MTDNFVPLSVMEEAHALVNGERAASYGHPQLNFDRITKLWNAYLWGRAEGQNAPISAKDHAIMMILVKVARLQQTPDHRDSLVDICGYVGTYEKLISREQEQVAQMDSMYAALAASIEDFQEPPLDSLGVGSVVTTGKGDSRTADFDGKIFWHRTPEGWRCAPTGITFTSEEISSKWGEHKVILWGS